MLFLLVCVIHEITVEGEKRKNKIKYNVCICVQYPDDIIDVDACACLLIG